MSQAGKYPDCEICEYKIFVKDAQREAEPSCRIESDMKRYICPHCQHIEDSEWEFDILFCKKCKHLMKIESDLLVDGIHTPHYNDIPEKVKTGWTMIEQHGWKIYKKPKEQLTMKQLYDDREWPRDDNGKPLYHKVIRKGELKENMHVIFKGTLSDYLWAFGTVNKMKEDFIIESGNTMALVKFSDDDRNCYVITALINTKAIAKMKVGK